MATVHEPLDDAASISSVPDSAFASDSEPDDDMGNTLATSATPNPATSAKDREAQAESSRARQVAFQQRQQQRQRQTQDQPSSADARPAEQSSSQPQAPPQTDTAADPDDVPPPPYSEALRQGSRPDDAVRYAWRQGISEGSLDMNSFNRLVSPTAEHEEAPPTDAFASAPRPNDNNRQIDLEAQNNREEQGPIPDAARTAPDYGSIPDRGRGGRGGGRGRSRGRGRGRGRRHDHSHHEHGHLRETRSGYQQVDDHDYTSDDTSDPSEDELAERRRYRKSNKGRSGCLGGWKRNDDWYNKFPRWWDDWSQRRQEERRRRRYKKLAFLIVVLVLLMIVLMPIMKNAMSNTDKSPTPGIPDDNDNTPEEPTNPGDVWPDDPSSHRASFCSGAKWTRFIHHRVEPNDGDLAFFETLTHPRFKGIIRLVPAPSSQAESIRASIAYAVDPKFEMTNVGFTSSPDGLRLTPPVFHPDPYHNNELSCTDADVIFSIKPTLSLQNLVMSAAHLSIAIDKHLFGNSTSKQGLQVQNSTLLETTHGKVTAQYAGGQDIHVHTQSGRVEGTFALYHRLHITTSSGAISIIIEPQPAPKDNPAQPATVDIESHSGRVEAHMPTSGKIPNRNYQTFVQTSSSAITGDYIFGEQGVFASSSGRLDTELLPYVFQLPSGVTQPSPPTSPSPPAAPIPPIPPIPAAPTSPDTPIAPISPIPAIPAIPPIPPIAGISPDTVKHAISAHPTARGTNFHQSLKTDLISSQTHVRLLEPVFPLNSRAPFVLSSTHIAKSGAMDIVYPRAWTGNIAAQTISGRIDVSGSGLERISGFWGWWSGVGEKGVWRRRSGEGDEVGDSNVNLRTISSRIGLTFRD
ncbi:hypothetical protein K461DRAFT_270524 [Myriangium duriaei CBS 260.36]|uniref:Uncharacterized protein n=1 Tax=Myriangium duriaei CBS 260.36 TaxID=1168546 RepID=A0A9P4IY44_9PEZI|nr:hypothetical protein K461DRAFT_270524 [Myriangium duriaei CBS 260.36]